MTADPTPAPEALDVEKVVLLVMRLTGFGENYARLVLGLPVVAP